MRRILLGILCVIIPGLASAQSSQFGVRGLGTPSRPLSVDALGSGGAFGMFDPESSLNPAALSTLQTLTAVFSGVEDFRHVENPAGQSSVRNIRFPQLGVVGPIRRFPVGLGINFSSYLGRDFTIARSDTILLRDEALVPVSDTISSRGGLSDLRFAGAYRLPGGWSLGTALHVISGSARLESRRTFGDPAFGAVRQRSEISYAGAGIEIGVVRSFGSSFSIAATARSDGHVNVDRDSSRVSRVDLPYTFGLGVRWRTSPKLELAGQGLFATWSGANSDILEQGGTGADNTVQFALGGEYTGDPRRPFHRPIRFGVRYATLPFPIVPGEQPKEFGVSVGSGIRFAQQRAGVDLGLEHVWRSAGEYSERAFLVSVGVTVRP